MPYSITANAVFLSSMPLRTLFPSTLIAMTVSMEQSRVLYQKVYQSRRLKNGE
jgi:hypothetical protein